MRDDVKLRLYVTAVIIVMLILYTGPLTVLSHEDSIRDEVYKQCSNKEPSPSFDYCWELRNQAVFPIWEYSLPYLPAVVLLWINWLLKPSLKQSLESYPTR